MFYYINVRCYHYYDDPITIVFLCFVLVHCVSSLTYLLGQL